MNMKSKLALLVLLAIVSITAIAPSAHSQEVPADERATFVFDIDLVRLRNSESIQSVGLESILSVLEAEYILPPDVPVRELNRFQGAFEFSESWDDLIAIGPGGGKIPMDFYVQLQFSSEEALNSWKEEMVASSSIHEHEGKTYYGPPENGIDPLNLRIGFDGLTMEAGTTNYIYHPENRVLTDTLAAEWDKVPKDNFARAAIDLKGSRELVDGFLAQFEEELSFEPTFKMLAETTLKVIDDVEVASGYFDLDNDKILSLNIEATNEAATEKIEGVVNGLLFMAVLPIKNGIKSLGFESKDDEKPLLQLADQLKATKSGTEVKVEVIKSEQYKEACERTYFPLLKEWTAQFKVRNDLEMVAQAAINYNYYFDGRLPFATPDDGEWNEDISWRVHALQNNYQSQFRMASALADYTASWEDDTNKELLEKMPPAFGPKGNRSNIVWVKTKVKKLDDVTDGEWDTIMLLRLPEPTDKPWTHPEDEISVIKVLQLVSSLEDDEFIYAATYSGRVIRLDNTWKPQKLKTYLTPNAGDSYEE